MLSPTVALLSLSVSGCAATAKATFFFRLSAAASLLSASVTLVPRATAAARRVPGLYFANFRSQTGSEHTYQPLPGLVFAASILKIPSAVSTWRVNCALANRRRQITHIRTGPSDPAARPASCSGFPVMLRHLRPACRASRRAHPPHLPRLQKRRLQRPGPHPQHPFQRRGRPDARPKIRAWFPPQEPEN